MRSFSFMSKKDLDNTRKKPCTLHTPTQPPPHLPYYVRNVSLSLLLSRCVYVLGERGGERLHGPTAPSNPKDTRVRRGGGENVEPQSLG